jgi:hypothetical protein
MDWQSTLLLAGITFAFLLLWSRSVRQIRRWMIPFLYLPTIFFSIRWTIFRKAGMELLVALILGTSGYLVWWLVWGRNLPPPKESEIIVLTDEDE